MWLRPKQWHMSEDDWMDEALHPLALGLYHWMKIIPERINLDTLSAAT